jgi:hypothetical protein
MKKSIPLTQAVITDNTKFLKILRKKEDGDETSRQSTMQNPL